MTLRMGEPLQLSRSLLTRSAPNAPGQTDPSIADRATSTNPHIGGCRHKRPLPVPKRKQALSPTNKVMTQIELPPYRRPP
jgi:hypothetical protein